MARLSVIAPRGGVRDTKEQAGQMERKSVGLQKIEQMKQTLEPRQHGKRGCGEACSALGQGEGCTQKNTHPAKLPACEGEPLGSSAHMN